MKVVSPGLRGGVLSGLLCSWDAEEQGSITQRSKNPTEEGGRIPQRSEDPAAEGLPPLPAPWAWVFGGGGTEVELGCVC